MTTREFLQTLTEVPQLERRAAPGNRPFSIEEPDKVWVVVEGNLELFLVTLKDGKPSGMGFHLLKVESGGALFGMAATSGYRLMARGGVSTAIVELSQAQLNSFGSRYPEPFALMVESWVMAVQSISATSAAPTSCILLSAGAVRDLIENEKIAASARCLWLSSDGVGLNLFDHQGLPPVVPFPLGRPAWVTATRPLQVKANSTEEIFRAGKLWDGLDAFHRLARELAVEALLRQRSDDDQRIVEVARINRLSLTGATQALASVIPGGGRLLVEGGATDPLLAACQLVGKAINVDRMRRPAHRSRASGNDVNEIAQASRVRVRAVGLSNHWWKSDSGALLGFLDDDSPVALLPFRGNAYNLVDPRDGKSTRVDRKLASRVRPKAFTFYQPLPDGVVHQNDLFGIGLSLAQMDLLTVFAMAVLGGILGLVQPVATGLLIGEIVPSEMRSELFDLGAALLAANIAAGAFEFTRSVAMLRLDGKMDGSLQSAVFDRLLRLPAPFFSQFSTGDLASRALGINSIRQMMTSAVTSSLLGGVTSLFSFGLLFFYDWSLALVALILVGFYMLSIFAVAYLNLREQRPLLDVQGRIQGLVLQLLNGVRKLRGAGAESRAYAQWARLFASERRINYGLGMINVNNTAFQAGYSNFCSAILFGFLAWRGYNSLSPGSVVAFFGAFGQFLGGMTAVSTALTSLVSIGPTLDRAKPILSEPPEVSDDLPDPEPLEGRLELKGVTFRYQKDGPPSLNNIELVAEPGEFVAIVGPSGAGKSTLLRLLLGFEKADSGSILYDGQDIQSVNLQSLRRQLGVVLQESKMMPGSILENILGSSLLTIEDAWEAAEIAGIAADIKTMPMGMHTVVTEGSAFSGGQLQRMVIARAVVTRPRVLFFDEATSALDNATQEHVSRGLEGLKATRIVIAHRLSTIQNADRIYVLNAETRSFAQVGVYEELINQPGEFQELARRQMA